MWTLADFQKTRWSVRSLEAIFVAQHGDDRNDGHPQRPVASLNQGILLVLATGSAPILVVGSGVYSESLLMPGYLGISIIGDGFVTLDGLGITHLFAQARAAYLRNVTVQNYTAIAPSLNPLAASNCRFNNISALFTQTNAYANTSMTNCVLKDAPRREPEGNTYWSTELVNCTLINSLMAPFYRAGNNDFSPHVLVRNTYADATSTLPYHDSIPCAYYNNVIQGKIKNWTLADFAAAFPGQVIDCQNVVPGFNNPSAGDYTLSPSSQMRNLATDGGFVGAYGIGINFAGLPDADVLTNMQWNNTLGAFVLTNPALPGSVEFVVKDFQRNWILEESLVTGSEDTIDHQTIDATISYEQDGFGAPANVQSGALEPGYTYWVNGYDSVTYQGQQYLQGQFFPCLVGDKTYTTVGAGKVVRLLEAPNIRLYELKFSTVSAVDCVSKPWQYFIFNKIPTTDAAGRSNGDPLFDPATANPITVRWPKLRLTLMPNSLA